MIFVVTILPDNTRVPVRAGETLLEGTRRYGYAYTIGCREGGCGACELELISGEVQYPKIVAQSVLSDEARAAGRCLPCRAVPCSDIVIKLQSFDRLRRAPYSDLLAARDLAKPHFCGAPSDVQSGQPGLAGNPSLSPVFNREDKNMSDSNAMPNLHQHRDLHGSEWEAELQVVAKEIAADGVVIVTLSDASGAALPEWGAGAHIDLLLDEGLTRQYSLCGQTHNRHTYRVGVLLDQQSRGGSVYVHDQLHVGGAVRVRGPRNHFPFKQSGEYVFIAGGIGITPILPMIAAAEASGGKWHLHYGGRNLKSMAFVEEVMAYEGHVSLYPEDEVGRIPVNALLEEPREGVLLYCCGPGALLDAVEVASAHWPDGSLNVERFSAKKVEAPIDALSEFEVVCQRSGITLTVGEQESILEAVEKAGLKVSASCRAGVCGTCEVDVIEGLPDHRDSVLTREEKASNEFMLVCCSRSRSKRLVLDM